MLKHLLTVCLKARDCVKGPESFGHGIDSDGPECDPGQHYFGHNDESSDYTKGREFLSCH
jgi:hypothetical protein